MAKSKSLSLIVLVAIALLTILPIGVVLAQEELPAEDAAAEEAGSPEEAPAPEGEEAPAEDAAPAEGEEAAEGDEVPAAPAEEEGDAGSVQDYFAKGGVVMYPLLLTSVLAGAYIIERLFTYQFAKIDARKFTDEVVELVNLKPGDRQQHQDNTGRGGHNVGAGFSEGEIESPLQVFLGK